MPLPLLNETHPIEIIVERVFIQYVFWSGDISFENVIVYLMLFLNHFFRLELCIIDVPNCCLRVEHINEVSLVVPNIIRLRQAIEESLQFCLLHVILVMKYRIRPIVCLYAL